MWPTLEDSPRRDAHFKRIYNVITIIHGAQCPSETALVVSRDTLHLTLSGVLALSLLGLLLSSLSALVFAFLGKHTAVNCIWISEMAVNKWVKYRKIQQERHVTLDICLRFVIFFPPSLPPVKLAWHTWQFLWHHTALYEPCRSCHKLWLSYKGGKGGRSMLHRKKGRLILFLTQIKGLLWVWD